MPFLYKKFQYGKDYEFEAPVKLLNKLVHELPQSPEEQIVVVSQVLPCLHSQPIFPGIKLPPICLTLCFHFEKFQRYSWLT